MSTVEHIRWYSSARIGVSRWTTRGKRHRWNGASAPVAALTAKADASGEGPARPGPTLRRASPPRCWSRPTLCLPRRRLPRASRRRSVTNTSGRPRGRRNSIATRTVGRLPTSRSTRTSSSLPGPRSEPAANLSVTAPFARGAYRRVGRLAHIQQRLATNLSPVDPAATPPTSPRTPSESRRRRCAGMRRSGRARGLTTHAIGISDPAPSAIAHWSQREFPLYELNVQLALAALRDGQEHGASANRVRSIHLSRSSHHHLTTQPASSTTSPSHAAAIPVRYTPPRAPTGGGLDCDIGQRGELRPTAGSATPAAPRPTRSSRSETAHSSPARAFGASGALGPGSSPNG